MIEQKDDVDTTKEEAQVIMIGDERCIKAQLDVIMNAKRLENHIKDIKRVHKDALQVMENARLKSEQTHAFDEMVRNIGKRQIKHTIEFVIMNKLNNVI